MSNQGQSGPVQMREPWTVRATPGWSPVAIPVWPGWWRYLTDGEQVDRYEGESPREAAGE